MRPAGPPVPAPIVTQNVDGLHSAAGSPARAVTELHGNAHRIVCLTVLPPWPPLGDHRRPGLVLRNHLCLVRTSPLQTPSHHFGYRSCFERGLVFGTYLGSSLEGGGALGYFDSRQCSIIGEGDYCHLLTKKYRRPLEFGGSTPSFIGSIYVTILHIGG